MKLILKKEEFDAHLAGIETDIEKVRWAVSLSKQIDKIYRNYTVDDFRVFNKSYKISKLIEYAVDKKILDKERLEKRKTAFSRFRLYLERHYLSYINSQIVKLEVKLKNEHLRKQFEKMDRGDEKRYPLFDFDYSGIDDYCKNIIQNHEDKIIYYSHILKKYDEIFYGNDFLHDWDLYPGAKRAVKLIERDLERMKMEYKFWSKSIPERNKPGRPKQNNLSSGVFKAGHKKNNKYPKDKFVWFGTKEQLKVLFSELHKYRLIIYNPKHDPGFNNILSHFVDKDCNPLGTSVSPAKIKLICSNSDYIYLLHALAYDEKLISDAHLWLKSKMCFLKSDGSEINSDSLRSQASTLTGKPRIEINQVIKSVLIP